MGQTMHGNVMKDFGSPHNSVRKCLQCMLFQLNDDMYMLQRLIRDLEGNEGVVDWKVSYQD